MKKLLTLSFLLIATYFWFNYKAVTHSTQPQAGKTGAPGQVSCTQCHTGTANTGNGYITFSFPDSLITPDSTYTLDIEVTDPNKSKFGFQMIALNNSGSKAGTFAVTNSTNTALLNSSGKQYISHKNANTTNSWSFNWTAPSANEMDSIITFYIAGNAANNNGNSTGDNIYTASVEFNIPLLADTSNNDTSSIDSNTTNLSDYSVKDLNIFPNPTSDILHIANKNIAITKASLYSKNGSFIKSYVFLTKNDLLSINVRNLEIGNYFIKLYSNSKEMGMMPFVKN